MGEEREKRECEFAFFPAGKKRGVVDTVDLDAMKTVRRRTVSRRKYFDQRGHKESILGGVKAFLSRIVPLGKRIGRNWL